MSIIKKIMTSRNAKTIFFAGIIAAMILPFNTMNMADAATVQEDTKQKKINKLEIKLQDVEEKITSVKNKKSKLEQKLDKAQSNGNQERVKKLKDAIDRKEQNLNFLEDKKTKFKVAIAILKGDTVRYDDLSTTIDTEIKIFVNKLDKYSDDPEKIEKLNQRFADKMVKLQEKFEPKLDNELEKILGILYSDMNASDKSDMAYYIISEKFKIPMQEKFESDMVIDEPGFDLLGFEILPVAYAKCSTQPVVTKFKQVNVDVIKGVTGDNPLQTVSKDKLSSCLTKYTLTFKDQDHPYFDVAYDVAHYIKWKRVTDIEVFYVSNSNVWFLDSGSKTQTFNTFKPIHYQETNNFSNTVYVSNTWNHLMDTTNTNPTYSMKTWYK